VSSFAHRPSVLAETRMDERGLARKSEDKFGA